MYLYLVEIGRNGCDHCSCVYHCVKYSLINNLRIPETVIIFFTLFIEIDVLEY